MFVSLDYNETLASHLKPLIHGTLLSRVPQILTQGLVPGSPHTPRQHEQTQEEEAGASQGTKRHRSSAPSTGRAGAGLSTASGAATEEDTDGDEYSPEQSRTHSHLTPYPPYRESCEAGRRHDRFTFIYFDAEAMLKDGDHIRLYLTPNMAVVTRDVIHPKCITKVTQQLTAESAPIPIFDRGFAAFWPTREIQTRWKTQ